MRRYLIETSSGERDVELRFGDERVGICVLASGDARVNLNATMTITRPSVDAWLEILVILRDSASVRAAPNLEVSNDQVRAGHSLRTVRITDEELFYLMSRGLSRAEAEELVIEGLVAPYRDSAL